MPMFNFLFRILRRTKREIFKLYTNNFGKILFSVNGIKYKKKVAINGIPFLEISRTGACIIGDNCTFNSTIFFNPIGRNQKCQIVIGDRAKLLIGNNVGMSSTAIICHNSITIGNNVKIGGNTVIYDSDFHSLDFVKRKNPSTDVPIAKPVTIEDDVFIGAHCTILKGVSIGARAIVAAGSVVTRNIPSDEVWGGNPASKIR